MAWDPTQGQEKPGNGEQGQPGSSGLEPSPGSNTPQNPYQGQGQPGSDAADPRDTARPVRLLGGALAEG